MKLNNQNLKEFVSNTSMGDSEKIKVIKSFLIENKGKLDPITKQALTLIKQALKIKLKEK